MVKKETAKQTAPKRRMVEGKIVSTKGTQTVIVEVQRSYRHPLYKKTVRFTKRFAAHNLLEDLKVGDHVRMAEVPPVSKTKHFQIVEKFTL